MKKILTIMLLTLIGLANTSCDKYLDVNKNMDAPDYVEAYLYLAGIESAWSGLYYDIRATGPLSQMMGTSSYTSYATNFYSKGSDAAGEIWRLTYWLQGYNLENMIKQSIADEAWTLAGIGYAIKAFSWDQLTKHQVDLPMKQAFVPGLLSHEYDYQSEIYPQIREWAETAIEYLEMDDKYNYGTNLEDNDRIYGGNKDKWIKFAHSVIVRNLASLSNKSNFTSEYAQSLIDHAALAFQTPDDDAVMSTQGGGSEVQFNNYNNFWGAYRGNLSNSYWQHDYIVQIMTGTVPEYDEETGEKVPSIKEDSRVEYYPFQLNPNQIICDTMYEISGHFDPRIAAKLSTGDDPYYINVDNVDSIKKRRYYGSSFTSSVGPVGTARNFFGRTVSSNTNYDGIGRWIFRDNAPYILMTSAEMKFDLAEAYWKLGQKGLALQAWKEGIKNDMTFTAKYLYPGSFKDSIVGGANPGGDKITVEVFNNLADEYLAGPYVDGIDESSLTLSHIMMQKYVALFPWGSSEAWVDLRKYFYDIKFSGEYPSLDNGWSLTTVDQKWDTDETKVYKGFYLAPAQVENRRGKYNIENYGSPCFRIRPRYNSEYMWNEPSLEKLKPISGTALNYQCSIPWFAYPGDYPKE